MTAIKTRPSREEVDSADRWDLTPLFPGDEPWRTAFGAWEASITGYEQFRGKLGESAEAIAACLDFETQFDRAAERLGTFAFLKTAEDAANSTYQSMLGGYRQVAARAAELSSFVRPELLAIDDQCMQQFLAAPVLAPYRRVLQRALRFKPYTLSDREERLLAMHELVAGSPARIFRQLHDADLKFGGIEDEHGEQLELSHASLSRLLHATDRNVRSNAFHQYYRQFVAHENTFAAALSSSIQADVVAARARGYDSALHAALFPDDVPQRVYVNLISAVNRHLPALHRYYDLRRRKMGLETIHHYDTYVPILPEWEQSHTWEQSVEMVISAVEPLGDQYGKTLAAGLDGRWCDRYENQGKQSGAFSYGWYEGHPYILMNYQSQVLDHVFTLAHEAGHAMHSWYSARQQPFQDYHYTIFVAEVASTLNEELLSRYLLERAESDRQRAFLINRQIDAVRATILRQTMFAEFEKTTHALVEAGEALTVARFKEVYADLLKRYFGPDFTLDDELHLECMRIPHFYRAFYVYKYATGMAAAMALAQRILTEGAAAQRAYLDFLSAGCSKYPLELLRDAGVDMAQPEALEAALVRFEALVDELDRLL